MREIEWRYPIEIGLTVLEISGGGGRIAPLTS